MKRIFTLFILILVFVIASPLMAATTHVNGSPGETGTDANAIHDNVSGEIDTILEKETPASNDLLIMEDSGASNVKKKVKIGNLLSPIGAESHTSNDIDPDRLAGDSDDDDEIENSIIEQTWTEKQDFQKSFTTLTGPAMWNCWARTGGATGSLDAIPIATLTNGDIAVVLDSSYGLYVYRFNSTATDAESDPDYVRPDDYSSAGVWYLTSSMTNMKADDPYISLREKDGTSLYFQLNDSANRWEVSTDSTPGSNVLAYVTEAGSVVASLFIQGGIAQFKDGAADGNIAALSDTTSAGTDGDPLELTTAEMMGTTITNLGAEGALYFQLPAAAIGMNVIFNADAAQNMFLKPPSGTKFYFKDYDDTGFAETVSADKDIQMATATAIGDRMFVQARKVGASIQYFVWSDCNSVVFEAE